MLGLGAGAVQRELATLTRCGIVTRTVEGNLTWYQANPSSPIFAELRGLVRKTFGVTGILHTALEPLAGRIRVSFIYGSVAAGQEKAGSDIDLMVIGDEISLDEITQALANAQREAGREINPTLYAIEEFRRKLSAGHHFVSSLLKGPKLFLIGNDNELTRLAQIRVADRARGNSAGNRRPVRGRGSRSRGVRNGRTRS